MQVINKAARLITINHDGEKYRLLPAGDAVEMPDEAEKDCRFLQLMVDDGSVKILPKTAAKAVKSADTEDDDPLADLRAEAKELGVPRVTKLWGKDKLEAAIAEAKASQDPAE